MSKAFKIGVIIDSFLKPTFREGLESAVKVGAGRYSSICC